MVGWVLWLEETSGPELRTFHLLPGITVSITCSFCRECSSSETVDHTAHSAGSWSFSQGSLLAAPALSLPLGPDGRCQNSGELELVPALGKQPCVVPAPDAEPLLCLGCLLPASLASCPPPEDACHGNHSQQMYQQGQDKQNVHKAPGVTKQLCALPWPASTAMEGCREPAPADHDLWRFL